MNKRAIGGIVVLVTNLAIATAVGVVAARFPHVLPLRDDGAVFTAGSVVGGVLLALGLQVFGKLDRLLTDIESHDYGRVASVYSYVGLARARVIIALLGALTGLVLAAASAYLIKEAAGGLVAPVTLGIGYAGLATVLLSTVRVVRAYLSLDEFRRELFELVTREERRLATLADMRSPDAIGSFRDDEPPHVGTLHALRG